MAEDDRLFDRYLAEWVYGVKDHREYLDRIGETWLAEIRADSVLGYRKGLERR
jgi:glutaconate CoA-transferase subunit A